MLRWLAWPRAAWLIPWTRRARSQGCTPSWSASREPRQAGQEQSSEASGILLLADKDTDSDVVSKVLKTAGHAGFRERPFRRHRAVVSCLTTESTEATEPDRKGDGLARPGPNPFSLPTSGCLCALCGANYPPAPESRDFGGDVVAGSPVGVDSPHEPWPDTEACVAAGLR